MLRHAHLAESSSLWERTVIGADLSGRWLRSREAEICFADLCNGSALERPREHFRGQSVLIRTRDQITAALALIELDGIAGRLVLCPPDLPSRYIPQVISAASINVIVSDTESAEKEVSQANWVAVSSRLLRPVENTRSTCETTEWVLLTSGTTGMPKLVVHTLESLTGAISPRTTSVSTDVWSTFYDIRRYGGLQILLRALLASGSMVLSDRAEAPGELLFRVGRHNVTHISGTPSHWRRALMRPEIRHIAPSYVRLSGEIVDQSILDHLRLAFPSAGLGHAFASTEAGVAFEVNDGLAGFPASFVESGTGPAQLKVQDGSLRIRSSRTAFQYLGEGVPTLRDADDFVDTGDLIELRGDRYSFTGRRDGVINMGGLKVHPEEVEAVINGHSGVRMSRVRAKKSPITGEVVIAEVVRMEANVPNGIATESNLLENEILQLCRSHLPRHKVPATIRFVPDLELTASGKVAR
jgi:acyl-coenzyme A synthetase/AMP-(fatty) acid ligase